jgi:sugar phosphate isomerase/epimerase
MKVAVFKSLWGMTGTLEGKIEQIVAGGYDGVETGVTPENVQALPQLLAKNKLPLIAMLFTQGKTVDEHIASFRELLPMVAAANPIKITAHSSRDKFLPDDQLRFYEAAAAAEAKCPVPVNHETHRGRAMFTPWTAAAILQRFPSLHVCADFSHWVCACESLLEDQEQTLTVAIDRTRHIHARVGYEEGPQVSDPAAPEFKRHLERHLGWWDAMIAAQKKAGAELATITPEFGPPNYLHTLPYTNQPVADLWQVCMWMKNLLAERYRQK